MKKTKFLIISIAVAFLAACGGETRTPDYQMSNANRFDNTNAVNTAASPATQNLTVTDTPARIKEMIAQRGEQDAANPTLKFVSPTEGATINSSTVPVRLSLGGELKGYGTGKDPQTGMGNHIHVILDNQPYEAYYNLNEPFELRNVADGEHTLRVFPSRPWHESYKNDGAFQMIRFTVKNGGADTTKPATTNSGQQMSNANASEGKEMQDSTAPAVDKTKPLLTYSRPKGEYKGEEADPIMIDFWLTNAKLVGDGGEYRVRYTIDGAQPQFIDRWQPVWLAGWGAGKRSVKLELVDKQGNPVENGGYNSTTREITVVK
ncbi:MAG TPA: hypothetical protein VK892_22440 [Pyrinomonadaceae bacterium]|nr:hypothetical protein [Pyrinomonadaceae bacterium]